MVENVRHLLLHGSPGAPGAEDLLRRFGAQARAGSRVLLAGPGLAWAGDKRLGTLPGTVDVAVCSQDARRAGWTLESAPQGVRWSSVATWLAELPPGSDLWTVLP